MQNMATQGCFRNARFATIRLFLDSAVLNPCTKRLRNSLSKLKTINSINCTPAHQLYIIMTVCSDRRRRVTCDVTWCCSSCRPAYYTRTHHNHLSLFQVRSMWKMFVTHMYLPSMWDEGKPRALYAQLKDFEHFEEWYRSELRGRLVQTLM